MKGKRSIEYFLGANTFSGFYSLYDGFTDPTEGNYTWYIKGGPGSGKSSFMRQAASAAEQKGYTVEYILCSGDPSSLDGICIKEMKTAYVDATAPHVQEPALPGAAGRYIDLTQFYIDNARFDSTRIASLYRLYRKEYERAYDFLGAAELCLTERIMGAPGVNDLDRIRSLVNTTADRLIPQGEGYTEKKRFISAYTPMGKKQCIGTLLKTGKIQYIHSNAGFVDPFISCMAEDCRVRGQAFILLPDPLRPEYLEGIQIPGAKLSFLASDKNRSGVLDLDGTIRSDPEAAAGEEIRTRISLCSALIRQAEKHLKKAGDFHKELEDEYHPYIDFQALQRFTEEHIRKNFIND